MEKILFLLEIAGTFAFAVSGAVTGIHKRLDIFGVLVCAVITALGGGVLRDIMISNLPPAMFQNETYFLVTLVATAAAFCAARILKNTFSSYMDKIEQINNLFDAAGLGVFTVIGMNTAIAKGFGDNAFFVIFLGMITGCGGGILRDVLVQEMPMVFYKRIYAVASLAGSILYYFLRMQWGIGEITAAFCGAGAVFLLRVLASVFRWDLPKAF